MSDFRLMSAMVLFRLEQALGSVVLEKNPELDEQIIDIANSITTREISKKPDTIISTTAELIAETYLDDLFQLALRVTHGTSDYAQWLSLKDLCSSLSIYQIRNAVAHPNRPFPECYWYRVAAISTDPLIQQLGLGVVVSAFESALEGKITPPPDAWMKLPEWMVPNNLPKNSDFEITGLIGRPNESKDLQKYLQNPRINCISIVAPGGVGKTALAMDVLDKACKTPEFRQHFNAVIFVSLKLEKLTATGVEELDAPSTISEIEAQLTEAIPAVLGDEDEAHDFSEIIQRYENEKLLLFIDNLETLLRDSPSNFDEFQMKLPVHWRLLVTSRVPTNSATCLTIGPLVESTAKHLARIYATRRNASELVKEEAINIIVKRTHCNPLAIRLGVDSYILGSSLEDSVTCASTDVLNFSYKMLLDVISSESVAVLECLFLQDPQTRISLAENINFSIDMVANGIQELARTSLIARDSSQQQELYSLYPAIRDLLLISPQNPSLRSEIQQRILRRRTVTAGAEQQQSVLPKHHYDFVPSELPEVVKTVLFEVNRVISKLNRTTTPEDALKLLGKLRELRTEYPKISAIWRFSSKISLKLGDTSTAAADLRHALEIAPGDLSALKMLGRLGHDQHDYNLSLECYTKIKELSGWDISVTDQQNARYCCNGYLLAQLYLGKYSEILQETQDWATDSSFKDLRGAFRARAWKRSVETKHELQEITHALNKATNILDDLAKEFGYPDVTHAVYKEVIEEIASVSRKATFHEAKQAKSLLDFAAMNISHAFKDEKEDLDSVLSIAQVLEKVTLQDNPFRSGDWQEFIRSKGGRVYVDEDRKNSLQEAGYILVNIYHIPKQSSPFVFAKDGHGNQHFVHYSCAQETSWPEWIMLKDGDVLAIRTEPNKLGLRAARAKEVILL